MKDFKKWLVESVLPTIKRAAEILQGNDRKKEIIERIRIADPYQDKRFAPVIARWVVDHNVTPEEHIEDITTFKRLRNVLKDLRVPATNPERRRSVKQLLAKKPDDFASHYSALQDWNRTASDITDPNKDLSDDGLPVVMRHNGYTMYRIDRKEHCQVPLVKNAMGWCITKEYFGNYGGPPYYPIVRDHDREPFAMVIPAHFDRDPDEAVRNANNDGRISPQDLAKIRPLVQHVLPIDAYKKKYIQGVHGVKRRRLPKKPSASTALRIITDHAMQPGEWPAGETAIANDAEIALHYAEKILHGPFPEGEDAIARNVSTALAYARNVLKGPFPKAEPFIAKNAAWAYKYANEILDARFPEAEPAIMQYPYVTYKYARYVLRRPWPDGEKVIAQDGEFSYEYAKSVLKGPFPMGEKAIARNGELSYEYARNVLQGPFPMGEQAIEKIPKFKELYSNYLKILAHIAKLSRDIVSADLSPPK